MIEVEEGKTLRLRLHKLFECSRQKSKQSERILRGFDSSEFDNRLAD
jgi:hypothetical protein